MIVRQKKETNLPIAFRLLIDTRGVSEVALVVAQELAYFGGWNTWGRTLSVARLG